MASGVLAVGDSITKACTVSTGSMPLLSWAQHVARAVDQPLTVIAENGYTSADVRRLLLPRIEGRFLLGLVFVGTNDLAIGRGVDEAMADVRVVLETVARAVETIVVVTPGPWTACLGPVALHRGRVERALAFTDGVRELATQIDAVVVPVQRPHRVGQVAGDRIHLSAAGHLTLACDAVRQLCRRGWTTDDMRSLATAQRPGAADYGRWARAWVAAVALSVGHRHDERHQR